ncbi:TetR/AcrR family transcriptional regulator [Schaalia sp. 19OD2882]|uniref:TetR/AcrR family transcriptional regulator n=1 Tax=Schaalia sp. 19OD2882 TaxID=2794089 RepID=UPI001C1ED8BE|nr:TetR/AcrR family transcriptional regulator [Schaalia sp. 19OD2882]QWW19405.1 TetR/AcrR family transcriptional regulator [Schaalia sp. 19OD2882]
MGSRYETQDRLIAATRQIIIDEGVEATNLEHICKVAGFSRGAFYSNFSSKDSLLAAMAEDEYSTLIERLRATVDAWAAREDLTPSAEGSADEQDPLMENLLFEALDAIGVDNSLYVLHSELLMRSIRDQEWGMRLLEINVEFVNELGRVLEYILVAAGRRLTKPLRAITHAVIGIVMRASGVAAWRNSTRAAAEARARDGRAPALEAALTSSAMAGDAIGGGIAQAHISRGPSAATTSGSAESNAAGREVLETILLILYGASEPSDQTPAH